MEWFPEIDPPAAQADTPQPTNREQRRLAARGKDWQAKAPWWKR